MDLSTVPDKEPETDIEMLSENQEISSPKKNLADNVATVECEEPKTVGSPAVFSSTSSTSDSKQEAVLAAFDMATGLNKNETSVCTPTNESSLSTSKVMNNIRKESLENERLLSREPGDSPEMVMESQSMSVIRSLAVSFAEYIYSPNTIRILTSEDEWCINKFSSCMDLMEEHNIDLSRAKEYLRRISALRKNESSPSTSKVESLNDESLLSREPGDSPGTAMESQLDMSVVRLIAVSLAEMNYSPHTVRRLTSDDEWCRNKLSNFVDSMKRHNLDLSKADEFLSSILVLKTDESSPSTSEAMNRIRKESLDDEISCEPGDSPEMVMESQPDMSVIRSVIVSFTEQIFPSDTVHILTSDDEWVINLLRCFVDSMKKHNLDLSKVEEFLSTVRK